MPDLWDERFTQADAEIIRHKVKTLIGRQGVTVCDEDDLRQELSLHVSRRMVKYDPKRGARSTFVSRVVVNKIAHILERRQAQKRGGGKRTVALEESNEALPDVRINPETAAIGVDVRAALKSLSQELRDTALLLTVYSPSEVAQQLGLSRGQFRERQKAIREHFENLGLNPAPQQPSQERTR